MNTYISAAQFERALRSLAKPGDKQLSFLQAHSEATGHALTATMLSDSGSYKSYRAINLLYGKLAKAVGLAMGLTPYNLSLLCDFIEPGLLTNREWILVMKSEFAEGLRRAKWTS